MAGSPRNTAVVWLPGTRRSSRVSPSAPTSRRRYSVTVSLPDGSQVSVYMPGCGPLESTRRFAGERTLVVAVGGVDWTPGVPVAVGDAVGAPGGGADSMAGPPGARGAIGSPSGASPASVGVGLGVGVSGPSGASGASPGRWRGGGGTAVA